MPEPAIVRTALLLEENPIVAEDAAQCVAGLYPEARIVQTASGPEALAFLTARAADLALLRPTPDDRAAEEALAAALLQGAGVVLIDGPGRIVAGGRGRGIVALSRPYSAVAMEAAIARAVAGGA